MPEHQPISVSVSGTVTAVFAHRFVVESKGAKHLADVGPEAVKLVNLKEGDKVTIRIAHKKKHDHEEPHAYRDPKSAIEAVTKHGFKVIAEPRRKPKHFEILGRSPKGEVVEFHVELDGDIRKRKPADIHEPKWKSAVPAE